MTNAGSDPVAAELKHLRESLQELSARVGQLAEENHLLRSQLEASRAARADLTAQAEHVIRELGLARDEARRLRSNN